MSGRKSKKQVFAPTVRMKETPQRAALPAAETSDARICWRFTHVDHDGPWGFEKVDGATLCGILQRLAGFETMTVTEVFRGNPGKDYEVAALPTQEALVRLEELGLADMTRIHCLRIQGEPRLYGFLLRNVFHVVWWDPRHEIWPSQKRNT